MKREKAKKDAGSIFNPVMYLAILVLTIQLMLIFVSYRRMMWLSEAVTDAMTDALLGAAVLNEEELYRYGKNGEIEVLNPKDKCDVFKDLLRTELGLSASLSAVGGSIPLIEGSVKIEDFLVYSIKGNDVTLYNFDESGAYETVYYDGQAGVLEAPNGMVVEGCSLYAEIGFNVKYMGIPVRVSRYHMVDIIVK